jgi:5'-3' exonuclease
MGIHSLAAEGFEADDAIASIAVRTRKMGIPTVILSTDKSFCQLVGSCITLFDHFNEMERDIHWIIEHFGVAPEKLVDLMTLAGDPGLSIPGIRNVGVQTASRLLDKYGSVDQLLLQVADISGKLGENIRQGIEDIELTRKLVTLRQDVHLGLNLQNFRYSDSETEPASH